MKPKEAVNWGRCKGWQRCTELSAGVRGCWVTPWACGKVSLHQDHKCPETNEKREARKWVKVHFCKECGARVPLGGQHSLHDAGRAGRDTQKSAREVLPRQPPGTGSSPPQPPACREDGSSPRALCGAACLPLAVHRAPQALPTLILCFFKARTQGPPGNPRTPQLLC